MGASRKVELKLAHIEDDGILLQVRVVYGKEKGEQTNWDGAFRSELVVVVEESLSVVQKVILDQHGECLGNAHFQSRFLVDATEFPFVLGQRFFIRCEVVTHFVVVVDSVKRLVVAIIFLEAVDLGYCGLNQAHC